MLTHEQLEKILLEEFSKLGGVSDDFKEGFKTCLSIVCRIFGLKK